jgi:ABC-type multidrug transport system fused ATPase/permease subunit
VLSDVSFACGQGEVVAVVGPVGAGKSSLLLAVLGELPSFSGSATAQAATAATAPVALCRRNRLGERAVVAYAPQEPFILNGTVRANILFGEEFDPTR